MHLVHEVSEPPGGSLATATVALIRERPTNNSQRTNIKCAGCSYLWPSVVWEVLQFKIDNATVVQMIEATILRMLSRVSGLFKGILYLLLCFVAHDLTYCIAGVTNTYATALSQTT